MIVLLLLPEGVNIPLVISVPGWGKPVSFTVFIVFFLPETKLPPFSDSTVYLTICLRFNYGVLMGPLGLLANVS